MILILEDDADREEFQRATPFVFAKPESSLRTPTVWISPEAYAKEKVLADLRAKVNALRETAKRVRWEHDAEGASVPALQDLAAAYAYGVVLSMIDGGSDA